MGAREKESKKLSLGFLPENQRACPLKEERGRVGMKKGEWGRSRPPPF
jgi:hypothetical protein